jgi:hypothetical protein
MRSGFELNQQTFSDLVSFFKLFSSMHSRECHPIMNCLGLFDLSGPFTVAAAARWTFSDTARGSQNGIHSTGGSFA